MSSILKGGRISSTRRDIVEFISSIEGDMKILKYVVDINKAHIIMLVENGIISKDAGSRILSALTGLEGRITPREDVEDIHVLVEEEVIKLAGVDVGGNLNLAKSRNDQVAAAIRMALREEILEIMDALIGLKESLMDLASRNVGTIIPGYTHLQPAQPTTLAHYLLAQFDALGRDFERLLDAYRRVNLSPMGAGALSTTSFPISRERVAELLGFDGLVENSIDAVSSRDFLLEALAALSIMAVNLSRLAEDLILWSSMEFGLVEIPEEFASTSSIMPQKKNPDVLEVIRARMGIVLSDFVAASTILKALPSTYNLDFQEATPRLWEACGIMLKSIWMLSEIIKGLRVGGIPKKPFLSFTAATELANMLFRSYNVPFRLAHKIVGALVRELINSGKSLDEATPDLLAEVSERHLGHPIRIRPEDLARAISLEGFIESHSARGGPSRGEVERMLSERSLLLGRRREIISQLRQRIASSLEKLRLSSLAESCSRPPTQMPNYNSKI